MYEFAHDTTVPTCQQHCNSTVSNTCTLLCYLCYYLTDLSNPVLKISVEMMCRHQYLQVRLLQGDRTIETMASDNYQQSTISKTLHSIDSQKCCKLQFAEKDAQYGEPFDYTFR